MDRFPPRGARIATTAVARAGWAIILLTLPERVLRRRRGEPAGVVLAARVLGVRHLLQAGVSALPATRSPTTAAAGQVAGLGALVDTMHAASCVGVAACSARWRRVALIDAIIESAFAAAGWRSREP